jgi:hypothetical protein
MSFHGVASLSTDQSTNGFFFELLAGMCIYKGHLEIRMAKQFLHSFDFNAFLNPHRGKTVAENVKPQTASMYSGFVESSV